VEASTGSVCEAGSCESLSAAIERVVALVGRRDIRDACRARVSGYSVDRAAAGIADAFRSATDGRPA
jgi:hypothetical protein